MIADLLGGIAMLYLLLGVAMAVMARICGSPYPLTVFAWMLFAAWHPAGWLAAILFIWLTRQR